MAGAYLDLFPDDVWRGAVWPWVGFTVWHLAPQLILPSRLGRVRFLVGAGWSARLRHGWPGEQAACGGRSFHIAVFSVVFLEVWYVLVARRLVRLGQGVPTVEVTR